MRKHDIGILGLSTILLLIIGYCICKSLCIGPLGEKYRTASMAVLGLQAFLAIGVFVANSSD